MEQPRNPIMTLLRAAEALEDWMSATASGTGGRAWTINSTASLWSDMESFYTATSGHSAERSTSSPSQVTIKGQDAMAFVSTVPSVKSFAHETPPRYGGMEQDEEGKETRRQMLRRRRENCQADEVDVALAPVLKIPISYCFYPDQYKMFRKLFPRVTPDSGLSYTHHDHPVAHTATLVGIRAMQNMLRPGEIALDIHGNPNGNEAFNRFQASRIRKRPNLPKPPRIDTMVEMRSSQDAVRMVTKWGEPFSQDGSPRYIRGKMDDISKRYDTYLSVHTLYYYGMYGVCKLLSKNPGSRMLALVNYSKEQMGTLYNELQFSKNQGVTTQTSPNGEKYVHNDIDHWFQVSSFAMPCESDLLGISWTSTNIGGPLYLLTITSCDPELVRYSPYKLCEAPTLKVMSDKSFLSIIKLKGTEVRLRISNTELAAELRHFMTFRDRNNPQTFLDLCVKARRSTGKDLIEGSRQFSVNDGELQDHIIYAYLVDVPGEVEVMDGVRLLKGELLEPLAKGLKLEGSPGFSWKQWLFGRPDVVSKGLGHAPSPPTGAGYKPKPVNTGGLIPRNRA